PRRAAPRPGTSSTGILRSLLAGTRSPRSPRRDPVPAGVRREDPRRAQFERPRHLALHVLRMPGRLRRTLRGAEPGLSRPRGTAAGRARRARRRRRARDTVTPAATVGASLAGLARPCLPFLFHPRGRITSQNIVS